MRERRIFEDIENKIIEEYLKGKGAYVISRELGISDETVYKYLRKNGIERRNNKQYRKHLLDLRKLLDFENYETQYWLGFIYADGYIGNYSIKLEISIQDEEHLKKFSRFIYNKEFLREEHKILNNKECVTKSVIVNSKELIEGWRQMGFNKKECYLPDVLKFSTHFWRGVLDGDGSYVIFSQRNKVKGKIYKVWVFGILLCGDVRVLEQFNDWLERNGFYRANIKRIKEMKNSSFYGELSITNSKAVEVADLLYKDATVFLERKKEIYDLAKQYYERDVWRIKDFEEKYKDELERIAV